MKLFNRNMGRRIDSVTPKLLWLESQEAVIQIKSKQVSVAVYTQIDGVRVRQAEGVGDTILHALEDVYSTVQGQAA